MCSTFLSLFQNGSNLVESFLNIIRSYAETPGIFYFKKDQLMCVNVARLEFSQILVYYEYYYFSVSGTILNLDFQSIIITCVSTSTI